MQEAYNLIFILNIKGLCSMPLVAKESCWTTVIDLSMVNWGTILSLYQDLL